MNNIKLLLAAAFIFTCCIYTSPVLAQNNIDRIAAINVDDLTDAQVIQLLQQAQTAGLNDAQLIQLAQNRGMPAAQLSKLQARINEIRNKTVIGQKMTDTDAVTQRKLNYQPDSSAAGQQKASAQGSSPQIFGADIFRNKNNSFEPNLKLATPLNYILGPDDQLNINVYGNSLINWKLNISPEGNINIPGIGLLNVTGKTIEQATATIKEKLAANNYAIGHGTSVQVSLGNIRSIKVIMVGQLEKPGTYTLPSLATVFNALYVAGGPNNNGSFRDIEIIRDSRVFRHLDIYDFLLRGDVKDNITLRDQDIIRVPTYRTRAELSGQVKVPALFEVLPGETLQDIINFAGGFTDIAYTANIKVFQVSGQERRITDVPENDYKNYIPLRGDKYVVEAIIDRFENRVIINGAVFRPGEYELDKGLTVAQLIKKAAGLKEEAFTGRGSIVRLKPDNTTEQIAFNIKDVLNNTAPDIALKREDVVTISSIFDLRDQYRVSIKGEVRHPGEFAYADSMQVADLIVEAGGFTQGASAKRIEVSRRVFNSDPASKNSIVAQVFSVDIDAGLNAGQANFTLKPFDMVSVYSLPGYETQKTVKVEGEVVYPGYYTIQKKNEKISDLIARAGGLTASADAEGSSLKRDNAAVLGIDKTRTDTTELLKERADQLNRLKRVYKDSTANDTMQLRNNYIGIDLKGILAKPGTNQDLILENRDVLRVPKQQQIVKVNGEVLYPSAIVFDNGKSFGDYIYNAGGYSPRALRRSAYIVYPNGTVQGTRKFLFFNSHPAVKPGSEIYVPVKPQRRGLSSNEVVGLTTGVASIAAIILGIISLKK
jgi:protein involved in polysaccharide export with SLBB domain